MSGRASDFAKAQRDAEGAPARITKVPSVDPSAVRVLLEGLPSPGADTASVATDAALERELAAGAAAPVSVPLGPGGTLPLADDSLDALFTCHVLEGLRMDELYMLCAEARRVVRAGGYWALLAHHPGEGILSRFRARAYAGASGRRPLEIIHYVSPEDWETRLDRKIGRFGLVSQAVILRRIPG